MAEQAADLRIEHPDQLAAQRHLDTQKPFDREGEGVLLIHRRDVVETIEIRNGLKVGLVLDQLLGATMQQPDMRVDARHEFSVELKNQAQHAVCRRVDRAEVDGEVADFGFAHCLAFSSPGST